MTKTAKTVLRLAMALTMAAGAASAATVDVKIHDVASAKGRVLVSLCAKSEFLRDCEQKRSVPASRGDVVVQFSQMEAGDYAVMTFHDENGDYEMNRNALGVPTEGGGFSRNPAIDRGPPTFDQASVKVGAANVVVDVNLVYW